jgi:hypothetical protein
MRLLAILLLAAGLIRSAPSAAFDHEGYVWQRRWTPELAQALADAVDVFAGFRVLVGEVDVRGMRRIAVDWPALASAARPVTLVLRIPGAAPRIDALVAAARLREALAAAAAAGVKVAGIEIDHDCARSQLAAYATLLRELRASVEAPAWSITALPDWLRDPALGELLAEVDTSVLQVHAVAKPGDGLFDVAQALRWVRAYARVAPRPFRVALPAYATRVTQDRDGRILAIDSDAATSPVFDERARELVVDPRRVDVVLKRLRDAPPPRFDGIVWFRLPLASDRRAWSMATVRAVVAGTALDRPLRVERARIGDGPNVDIVMRNELSIDRLAPRTIAVPAHCRDGEGVAGYRFDAERQRFDSNAPPLLKPGASRTIGWIACQGSSPP